MSLAEESQSSDAEGSVGNPKWRNFSEPVVPPMLQAALTEFVRQGYHGTSIRTIALRAGISVPGLYHHYRSKQEILIRVMELAMADLYARSLGALDEAGDTAQERFRLHIECLVLFHAYRADLAFVAASEIRGLEPEARGRLIDARDRQQLILTSIVEQGVAGGVFRIPYPHDTTRAIITMCTGVSQWYRLGGALTPEQLAQRYIDISLNCVSWAAMVS